MSGNRTKELEHGIVQALTSLNEMKLKGEERRDKKYWSEIKVPLTLDEGLSNYTKAELDMIRKNLHIKNASSLKKAELQDLLIERIPACLEQMSHKWDSERFNLLTDIATNGGHIAAPALEDKKIDYLRTHGLIYTGVLQGKKVLALPVELLEPAETLKSNITVRTTVRRNTEWMKLTSGLLYYYGTLDAVQLVEMLERYTEEKVNFRNFLDVIFDNISYGTDIYVNDDGFCNGRVFDSKKVKQEHQMRNNVLFYPFTKKQLLIAGEAGYVERNKSYMQLLHFLTLHFDIDKAKADSIVEECVYATRIGESPNHVIQYLSNMVEFDSMETVQALMEHVVHLMNNTREWFLKGHTSTELSGLDKKHLQPLPTSKEKHNNKITILKVGRNQPCPCGSGKKHKKCCGR